MEPCRLLVAAQRQTSERSVASYFSRRGLQQRRSNRVHKREKLPFEGSWSNITCRYSLRHKQARRRITPSSLGWSLVSWWLHTGKRQSERCQLFQPPWFATATKQQSSQKRKVAIRRFLAKYHLPIQFETQATKAPNNSLLPRMEPCLLVAAHRQTSERALPAISATVVCNSEEATELTKEKSCPSKVLGQISPADTV